MSLNFGLSVSRKTTLVGVLLAAVALAPTYAGTVAGRGVPATVAVAPTGSVADFAAQLSIGGNSADGLIPADAPARPGSGSMPTFSGMRGSNDGLDAGHYLVNGNDWSNIALRDPGMFGQNGQINDLTVPQTSDRAVIPAPGAVSLASIGAGCLAWLKRRA